MKDILQLSALEQACAIREKSLSCLEVTETYLSRIEQLNETIQSFVTVFPKRARSVALQQDRILKVNCDANLPIFFGVPIGIKDLDFVANSFTKMGSRSFKYLWSPIHSHVTKRYLTGGFNILGKLATSEFAIMPVTETDLQPPCRNPWNLNFSPGGSSGGSASAVAAGLLPIAHASDGGGSIRVPAAFCHLYGLKPSRGFLPNFYHKTDPIALSAINAVTQTVEDSAAMLDVLTLKKYDPRRPDPESFLAQCQQPSKQLKIKYCIESSVCDVEEPIANAVLTLANLCQNLGHQVEPYHGLEAELEEFLPFWSRMCANVPAIRESFLQPVTRWLRTMGRQYTQEKANRYFETLEEKILNWFGDIDILLTPTVPVYPPEIGAWQHLSGEEAFMAAIPIGAFTAIFNVTGQPAANIPVGITEKNLPFGVQIVGRRGQEHMILALSRQLETALNWTVRKTLL